MAATARTAGGGTIAALPRSWTHRRQRSDLDKHAGRPGQRPAPPRRPGRRLKRFPGLAPRAQRGPGRGLPGPAPGGRAPRSPLPVCRAPRRTQPDQRLGLRGVTGLDFQGAVGPGNGDADLGRVRLFCNQVAREPAKTVAIPSARDTVSSSRPAPSSFSAGVTGTTCTRPWGARSPRTPDQRQVIVEFSSRVEPDLSIRRPGVLGAVQRVLPLLRASNAQDYPRLVRGVTLRGGPAWFGAGPTKRNHATALGRLRAFIPAPLDRHYRRPVTPEQPTLLLSRPPEPSYKPQVKPTYRGPPSTLPNGNFYRTPLSKTEQLSGQHVRTAHLQESRDTSSSTVRRR